MNFDEITTGLHRNPAGDREALLSFGQKLGFVFPDDYVEFMAESDGASGIVNLPGFGEEYSSNVDIYSFVELVRLTPKPGIDLEYPGLVLFGSSGGGDGYFFDRDTKAIIERPFIGDDDDAIEVGATLDEFFQYLSRGGPSRYPESLVPPAAPSG